MLGKLAAVEMNTDTHKKFKLKWNLFDKKKDDTLFNFFTKLYDMLSIDDAKEFSIQIGGKSFKVDPKNYSFWDKDLKNITENVIRKDWSANSISSVTPSSNIVKKIKV